MTTVEFSNEFDILYNNISSNMAPGLSEYEKSMLLTQAQESIIVGLYTGNLLQDSFEGSTQLTKYLTNLVKSTKYTTFTVGDYPNSIKVKIVPKTLFITLESVKFEGYTSGNHIQVKPITQDNYLSIIRNPYKSYNNRRVLRLSTGIDEVSLISNKNISEYIVTYLEKPSPIILAPLSDTTIDGISQVTECSLDSSIHRTILEHAVQLAKAIWANPI